MIIKKTLLAAVCLLAISAVGCAADGGNGSSGNGSNGNGNGQGNQGTKPLVTQPNDHMSGTVISVKQVGKVAQVMVETEDGNKMAVISGKEGKNLQPGDEVSLHGRRMYCNGQEVMRCDKCKKKNTNLCPSVKSKS